MNKPFRVLLSAATPFEIAPTLDWLRSAADGARENVLLFPTVEVEVFFTGVGLPATAFALGRWIGTGGKADLAIQAGIGGAIDRNLQLGEVVQIISECFGDVGAEERDGRWLSLGDIGLPPGGVFGQDECLKLPEGTGLTPFKSAEGISVSQVTGTEQSLMRLRTRWPTAQVESMEGAAFFRACLEEGMVPVQIRSISNYVEARDRSRWEMALAIRTLNDALGKLIGGFINR
ncbi:futalosine hydrolase [Neolewinella antarctica]|uniref:Futalosine hydrolase n=1 Tax=Neolewinella antarctica TaxID=442734 RepID=A0ABX0X6H8_9BACT|nr:futalosine hydrolase [Neolewinella antarctica]NJC24834.1 futalosine hydrolase [Neolewinella antarctica]